jgi:hypothetical protein
MGYRAIRIVRAVVIYAILTIFALIMLFPFKTDTKKEDKIKKKISN